MRKQRVLDKFATFFDRYFGVSWNLSSAKLVRNPDTVDGVQGGREVVG